MINISIFSSEFLFLFLMVQFSVYLNTHVFVMYCKSNLLLVFLLTVLSRFLCYSSTFSLCASVVSYAAFVMHYKNTPIQIYRNIYLKKLKLFR